MTDKDIVLFNEMNRLIEAYKKGDLALSNLGAKLLELRDGLEFFEEDWDYDFTQNLVTLDSASIYIPKNDYEKNRLSFAITAASDQIQDLIKKKINE